MRNNTVGESVHADAPDAPRLFALLLFRGLAFLGVHAIFAGGVTLAGGVNPWFVAGHWWQTSGTIVNIMTGLVLLGLMRRERSRLASLFPRGGQSGVAVIVFLVGIALAAIPAVLLARAFMAGFQSATTILFNSLPVWIAVTSGIAFPITIAAVELPFYYGYLLPRMSARAVPVPVALGVVVIVHSAQYGALPFLPAASYVLYRLLMMLPFALFAGVVIARRGRYMPTLIASQLVVNAWAGFMLMSRSLTGV